MSVLTVVFVYPDSEDLRSWRRFQVVRGSPQSFRVIPGVLQNLAVVCCTQQAPNCPSGVIVVNVQISASTSSADGTNATLSFKEFVVLPRKQPVCVLDPSFVTRLRASLLPAVGADAALRSEEPQSPVLL